MAFSKKELISKLRQTGFPLEFQTFTILEKLGIDAEGGTVYKDPADDTEREIDLHGRYYPRLESGRGSEDRFAIVDFIIECKKNDYNDTSWIFFTNIDYGNIRAGDFELDINPQSHSDIENAVRSLKDERLEEIIARQRILKKSIKIFQGQSNIHKSFVRVVSASKESRKESEAEKTVIYKSIKSVTRAMHFYKDLYEENGMCHLFFPIIVTGANLFSASMNHGNLKLKKVNYLIGKRSIIEPEDDGIPEYTTSHTMYFVVNKNYTKVFVKRCLSFADSVGREFLRSATDQDFYISWRVPIIKAVKSK